MAITQQEAEQLALRTVSEALNNHPETYDVDTVEDNLLSAYVYDEDSDTEVLIVVNVELG